MDSNIYFWAHMLDETKHLSYYDVYMQAHPEDKQQTLLDSLVGLFADCLKKSSISLNSCIKGNDIDLDALALMQKKVACKYYWRKIPSLVYAAVITRYIAMLDAAKGQRYLSELDYQDVRRGVSRKTIEDCLDIVCHNTNVLAVNNLIVRDAEFKFAIVGKFFLKHGIAAVPRYDTWSKKHVEDYFAAVELYEAWASYGKGRAGEKYVCDSDNGPGILKKILESCEYDADEIDLVSTLNKAVDVVHFRSDLANAFLEGGQMTAAIVSNLPKDFVV